MNSYEFLKWSQCLGFLNSFISYLKICFIFITLINTSMAQNIYKQEPWYMDLYNN